MGIEELVQSVKQGGVLFIEQEIGAEDGLACAEKFLQGYKIYKASPDKSAVSVFEKAMPQYSELFRIKTPPKVLASYFISQNGMMMANFNRPGMEMDSDIVSSMLSAVGNFVADTFSQAGQGADESKPKEPYGVLSSEGNTIQLYRGGGGVIALMYPGAPVEDVRRDLEGLSKRIDEKHLAELEKWNGEMNTPTLIDVQTSMKNFFFDSKRYEGELDIENLKTVRYAIKNNVLEKVLNESKSGKIAFLLDDVQNMDSFSIELMENIAREANIPIVCQYESGVLDEGLKNEELKTLSETLQKENKVYHTALKSDMNIEALVVTKLASIDEQAFEILRYAAVADEFDVDVLSAALVMPKSAVEEIGKKFAEIGILKGSRLANSRLVQRSLESIPSHRRGQVDIAVSNALAKKGDVYAPKIAELLLPYVETSEEIRENAVEFSIKAAEQFLHATNFEASLDYYKKAFVIDKDTKRKIQTSKQILDLEWITTKLDDMIEHANNLEKLADDKGDMHTKGFAIWARGKAYGSRQMFDEALKEFHAAEMIFKGLSDKNMQADILNAKGVIHKRKKEFEAALKKYDEALALSDESSKQRAMVLYNKGGTYSLMGDYENAKKFVSESFELHKRLGNNILCGSCLAELTSVHYQTKNFEKAIEMGNEAIDISLKNGGFVYAVQAYNEVGAALLDTNRHLESQDILERGITLSLRLNYPKYLWALYKNMEELHLKESKLYSELAEKIKEK